MSIPHAPVGLSKPAKRRWRARAGEFDAAGKLSENVLDSLASWAKALDVLAVAIEEWRSAGSPRTASGSTGQEAEHPLLVRVERSRRLEAKLNQALERALRRQPQGNGLPLGSRLVENGGGRRTALIDGVLHMQTDDGRWVLTYHEDAASVGLLVRLLDPDGIPRFLMPMPLRRGEPPDDDEMFEWGADHGVPPDDMLSWRQRWLDYRASVG